MYAVASPNPDPNPRGGQLPNTKSAILVELVGALRPPIPYSLDPILLTPLCWLPYGRHRLRFIQVIRSLVVPV